MNLKHSVFSSLKLQQSRRVSALHGHRKTWFTSSSTVSQVCSCYRVLARFLTLYLVSREIPDPAKNEPKKHDFGGFFPEHMATDLEAFARHRKSGKSGSLKINVDDVRMLDRRHEDLVTTHFAAFEKTESCFLLSGDMMRARTNAWTISAMNWRPRLPRRGKRRRRSKRGRLRRRLDDKTISRTTTPRNRMRRTNELRAALATSRRGALCGYAPPGRAPGSRCAWGRGSAV